MRWRIDPASAGDGQAGRVLRLEWRETGAPPDAPPPLLDTTARPRGFGTEVIERTLVYELGATTSLVFDPDGVRCDIAVPLTDAVAATVTGV